MQRIGEGNIGGKAQGLVFCGEMLEAEYVPERFPGIETGVPAFEVVATDVFDRFVDENELGRFVRSERTDEDIARAFLAARLPDEVYAALQRLLERVPEPLAVRSSSMLEDAVFHPLAGVYHTKMIPNNQPSMAERLEVLARSVKLVYASTFFHGARRYLEAISKTIDEEKMAVIVQHLVGRRRNDRFYPCVSGVARSHNFYPAPGSRPDEGAVSLALGLGKTIVDGGVCWTYSAARPKAPPPYANSGEMLRNSQLDFWSVNMAAAEMCDPTNEEEFLVRAELAVAEADGAIDRLASTYDGRSDRFRPGCGVDGPRLLNFAPLLELGIVPLNDVICHVLEIGERAVGADVEIEFAVQLPNDPEDATAFQLLQLRPMAVSYERVQIAQSDLERSDLLLASTKVMGNVCLDDLHDVVFVKPEVFETKHTRSIADQVEQLDRALRSEERRYLLIGFGRWGSSDPWLGIPVEWSQISGARVIVEATRPELNVEPSQGAHFFHNMCSSGVAYLSVHHESSRGIDWDWLRRKTAVHETPFVSHVRTEQPLRVRVCGRTLRGGVWRGKLPEG